MLTEAFFSGQLHLKVEVDPRLLSLKNPYAGPQGAQRPHDMSYYHGRFYLYYGATPVLLVYLPWRCLTGTYLDETTGTNVMLFGGFLLAVAWLVQVQRRWFPDLAIGWLLLLILAIGFSPPLFTEAANNTFYAVPIAGAYFCAMAMFTAVNGALSARRAGAQAGWLAVASLFGGLSVGARPIYVFGLIGLMAPAGWLWWQSGREIRWRWPGLRLLAASVLPAALIGLAIMTYNYLRFDNPLDFGIRFSMASGDLREARLVGTEFIPRNISNYLFTTVDYVRYFPFYFTGGRPWGIFPQIPFIALAALFPLTWLDPRLRQRSWVLAGVILLGGAGANLSLLCLFFGGEERYLMDFAPALMLLAAGVALALLAATRRARSRLLAWGGRIVVLALAAYAVFFGTMLGLSRREGRTDLIWLQRILNTPAHLVEQRTGTVLGPVELTLVFPQNRPGVTEPLVATGYGRGGGDVVSVRYVDATHVQFSAFHLGRGGPVSEPVEIDYAVPHRVRIAVGSLYPPAGHPLFSGWTASEVARIRRRLKIELDGQPVLVGNFTVHPSTPSETFLGHSNFSTGISQRDFTGRLAGSLRLGVDRAEAAGYETSGGPVRLTLRFPARVGDEGLPLVSTGRGGAGDLVFAQLTRKGEIRFGHDGWGAGAIISPSVPFDPAQDQVVEIEMGSLYPPEAAGLPPALRQRLRIVFNGAALLDTTRPFNPSKPDEVEFGYNTIGASSGIDYFPGAIRKIERIDARPVADVWQQSGPLRLAVQFPDQLGPRAEPLLVTGHAGRADVLFVRYQPDGTVRFGLDHWGLGVSLSAPVRIAYDQSQLLEISSGALLPPPGHPAWAGRDPVAAEQLRQRFELRLNGQPILVSDFAPYSNELGEVALGSNVIGASTCESSFSGRFVLVERLRW